MRACVPREGRGQTVYGHRGRGQHPGEGRGLPRLRNGWNGGWYMRSRKGAKSCGFRGGAAMADPRSTPSGAGGEAPAESKGKDTTTQAGFKKKKF